MSTATVIIDEELKKKALLCAKKDKLSLDEIIKILVLGYTKGDIIIDNKKTKNGLLKEEENRILQDVSDAKKGKNVSKYFENIDDLILDLEASAK